jgi:hypothetical protein
MCCIAEGCAPDRLNSSSTVPGSAPHGDAAGNSMVRLAIEIIGLDPASYRIARSGRSLASACSLRRRPACSMVVRHIRDLPRAAGQQPRQEQPCQLASDGRVLVPDQRS